VLADVVEALIWAAYRDGGLQKAILCIGFFLPELRGGLADFEAIKTSIPLSARHFDPTTIRLAEKAIGYSFRNKVFLTEALTHPSYINPNSESYQRLEFLGDAVLDLLVVQIIHESGHDLSEGLMTDIKHAVVNADFLAYLCASLVIEDDIINIAEDARGRIMEERSTRTLSLIDFLSGQANLTKARKACMERYFPKMQGIRDALRYSDKYPWSLLAQPHAEKFFSDVIESIMGAIYVDSDSDLAPCRAFLERLGLLPVMSRLINREMKVKKPIDQLETSMDRLKRLRLRLRKLRPRLETLTAGQRLVYSVGKWRDTWHCIIKVNEEEVGKAQWCLSEEEARVEAMDMACTNLEAKIHGEGGTVLRQTDVSQADQIIVDRPDDGEDQGDDLEMIS